MANPTVPDRPAYWKSHPKTRKDAIAWLKAGDHWTSTDLPAKHGESVKVYAVPDSEGWFVRFTRQPDDLIVIEVWDDKPGTAIERIEERYKAVQAAYDAYQQAVAQSGLPFP